MDIPDLVQQALGGEEIQAGVSLGDEDAVCLTPTRTLVYNGDGLLSDEQVEEFSHDVERIAVSEGRRKTKFLLEYIDGTRSFTVPANRDDKVLELLLEGVLRVEGVIGDRESLVGVYRFSELTLIVAEARIIKLIGEQVWNDDFEVYPFEDVTALEFERASVATSIVLGIDGRPQRVKVPNDNAPIVRQTIEKALFGYYDVASLDELNRVVGDDGASGSPTTEGEGGSDDIEFGSDIDPLVTDHEDDAAEHAEDALDDISTDGIDDEQEPIGTQSGRDQHAAEGGTETAPQSADAGGQDAAATSGTADAPDSASSGTQSAESGSSGAASDGSATVDDQGTAAEQATTNSTADETPATETAGPSTSSASTDDAESTDTAAADDAEASSASDDAVAGSETEPTTNSSAGTTGDLDDPVEPASREDLEVVADRMEELTEAVDRQNELLKRQHKAIKQLVDELQSE